MSNVIMSKMKPHEFFHWFGVVSEIPRGSGNEYALISYLEQFAADRGLLCDVDTRGNVYMEIPATERYEEQPSILFQAHMDIVCVKEPGLDFDFQKDPIHMIVRGDRIFANGTTLGADNGVGLATMLALADSKEIPHPKLELLFTVEEETGLQGIRNFDVKRIRSRRMINMDCGSSHLICVSSAGRIAATIHKQFLHTSIPDEFTTIQIAISGGRGGHSGIMINRGHACAGNVMGELLLSLFDIPAYISTLHSSENAILQECTATLTVSDHMVGIAESRIIDRFGKIKTIYKHADPDLKLDIHSCCKARNMTSKEDTNSIAKVLTVLHTGSYRLDCNDPQIVVTSSALGSVSLENGLFELKCSIRSSNDADKDLLFEKYKHTLEAFGVEITITDQYPGWPEKTSSPFSEKFHAVHNQLFGSDLKKERIHGGVEVSIIVGAIPDMDAVGIAPTATGAHTTQECLFIDEVAPFWEVLKGVLSQKD